MYLWRVRKCVWERKKGRGRKGGRERGEGGVIDPEERGEGGDREGERWAAATSFRERAFKLNALKWIAIIYYRSSRWWIGYGGTACNTARNGECSEAIYQCQLLVWVWYPTNKVGKPNQENFSPGGARIIKSLLRKSNKRSFHERRTHCLLKL